MARGDARKGSTIAGGKFVLLERCLQCGREFPAKDLNSGFCAGCDRVTSGQAPGVDIPIDPAPGRIRPILEKPQRFENLFRDFAALKTAIGRDALDRRLAPLETSWGPVSRYCSIDLKTGLRAAMIVTPFPHILEAIGPRITPGAGVPSWRIHHDNGIGPGLRVDVLWREIIGFETLCYLQPESLEAVL